MVPIVDIIKGAAQGGSSSAMSVYQWQKAKQLEKEAGARPEYVAPESATQALQNAQLEAMSRKYPGQEIYEQQIDQNLANQVYSAQNTASSSVGALEAIRGANTGANQLYQQSAIQGAEYQSRAKRDYIDQLMNYAGYQDKEWELNKWNPYEQKSTAAAALYGAAVNNAAEGISAGNYGGETAMGAVNQQPDTKEATHEQVTQRPTSDTPAPQSMPSRPAAQTPAPAFNPPQQYAQQSYQSMPSRPAAQTPAPAFNPPQQYAQQPTAPQQYAFNNMGSYNNQHLLNMVN